MTSSAETAGTGGNRLAFLDGLRGIAVILMVVNHTSRWWIDISMGLPRYFLVYGSLLQPGAIFLFLVGFCLPISYHAAGARAGGPAALLVRYGRRGLSVIGAGLLLNLLAFRDDPVWSWGVLQTIGLSIVVIAPLMPLLRYPQARGALLVLAVLFYVSFGWMVPTLQIWTRAHPVAARLWFLEFPPWPWLAGPLIGLVAGWWWLDARARGETAERRYFVATTAVGIAFLAAYMAWELLFPTTPGFEFRRDYMVNRHWTPRGATNLLIIGSVASLLGAMYWIQEVRRRPLAWLVVLGRAALAVYFLHHFLVLTLLQETLKVQFHRWTLYIAANVLLMVVLVWLGKAWLWLSPRVRSLWRKPAEGRGAVAR